MDEVTEDQCLICRRWPEAELANGRSQYFSTDATDRVLLFLSMTSPSRPCLKNACPQWRRKRTNPNRRE